MSLDSDGDGGGDVWGGETSEKIHYYLGYIPPQPSYLEDHPT